MAEMTAEKLGQRAFDVGLLDAQQLEALWGELGTRDVHAERFVSLAVRREYVTNFQIERLVDGKRDGYFYGKYKLLYMVGAGTFARVYRATHVDTKRVVAVKVLRQRYGDDLMIRENFLQEARLVIPLRHVNIVPIFEVDTENHRPFMVMDFVEGSNLREFVQQRGQLAPLVALRLMGDVAAGLEYAMTTKLTHRDMKLSNVLISSLGRAKLVDFGLAAFESMADSGTAGKGSNPRSIDYAGLERITGVRRNDPRSDIYFAGCMLYHMLSGKSPLSETRDRSKRLSVQRYREIKPLLHHLPNLHPAIVQLVYKAMDLKPERRIATPAELVSEIQATVRNVESGASDGTKEVAKETISSTVTPNAEVDLEGDMRTILVIEKKVEMQDVLRERLKKRGYRVLVIGNIARALTRFEDPDELPDCVIFSTAEHGEELVQAFNEFCQDSETRELPAVLLVDKRRRDLVEMANFDTHHVLVQMPLKVKELAATLKRLIQTRQAEAT